MIKSNLSETMTEDNFFSYMTSFLTINLVLLDSPNYKVFVFLTPYKICLNN